MFGIDLPYMWVSSHKKYFVSYLIVLIFDLRTVFERLSILNNWVQAWSSATEWSPRKEVIAIHKGVKEQWRITVLNKRASVPHMWKAISGLRPIIVFFHPLQTPSQCAS